MFMRSMRLPVVLAVAALAVPALGSGPAAAAGTAPRAAAPVLTGCDGATVTRPRSYVLACGDGNTALERLRWGDWGTATAHATGAESVNLCHPNCADGKLRAFGVTVTASRLRSGHYERLVIRFTGARAPGYGASQTYAVGRSGPSFDE
jgi:hypothetical protein